MTCRGEILPIFLLVALPVFCLITYGVAVSLGHVNVNFPYISDTGTHPPESCIFGLLQGIYAFLSAICVYFRYHHVEVVYKDSGRRVLQNTNMAGLIIGVISAFGVYLVANFQETNVISVHLVGAALAFIGGDVYIWIQTVMTYRMKEVPGHRGWMPHVRLVLTIIHLGSVIGVVVAAKMSYIPDAPHVVTNATTTAAASLGYTPRWHPDQPGYQAHLASTAIEWLLAITSAVYFSTFAVEFRRFRVAMPRVHYSAVLEINEMIQNKPTNGFVTDGKISTITA